MVPALVDKCLGSARAGTKAKAIELILKYIEVENGGEAVIVRPLGPVSAPINTDLACVGLSPRH